jgi:hypothetical protein
MKMIIIAPLAVALLSACASTATTSAPEPATVVAATPVADWRTRVTAAKALEDSAERAEAMLALLAEALPGREVRLSGSTHTDAVHPDDNVPAPIVNFDPHMNQKTSAVTKTGTSRSLQNNFGYYFSRNGVPYVVLGPAALDPRSPVLTELAAEHELFHATHHVGDSRPLTDRELETWTQMFVRYFPAVHQFRNRWAPMLNYYENASEGERARAIERLADYYRKEPSSEVRAAFDEWLTRRKTDTKASLLIRDLEGAR